MLIGWAVHPLPDPISLGAFFGSAIDLTSIGKVATVRDISFCLHFSLTVGAIQGLGNFSAEVFIDPAKFDITAVTTYTLNAAITSVIGVWFPCNRLSLATDSWHV